MRDRAGVRAYLLYRTGALVFRALPGPVAAGLAAGLARAGAALLPARRSVVAGNLRHVLGQEVTAPELDRVVRRSFASYGRYWSDAARLRPGHAGLDGASFSVEGAEHLHDAEQGGRGVVVALPHLGCWEVGGVWAASTGRSLTTVAEPATSERLFDWFVAGREALGLQVLRLGGDTAGTLSRALRSGGLVALLADRDVVGDGLEVPLFGSPTRLPAGPAVLALRTGAALLPCAVYHQRGGHHHAVVRPALDTARRGRLREDALRVTRALAAEMELLISSHPEQWHVFQPNWPPARP